MSEEQRKLPKNRPDFNNSNNNSTIPVQDGYTAISPREGSDVVMAVGPNGQCGVVVGGGYVYGVYGP